MSDHPAKWPSDQVDFDVLGEDEDFLAVGKPAGLLVHPTRPGGPWTLWDGLCGLLGYELTTGGQVSIINRLDRETSGVVVVAKTRPAARLAGAAMEAREVEKSYTAMVFGWPDWDEMSLDAPILRRGEVMPSDVHLERMIHESGAPALTKFKVQRRGACHRGRYAVVQASPQTGRTHQIRLHLAHLGFPILGDKLYARGSHWYLQFIETGWTPELEERLWLPRHALHCSQMAIAGRVWKCPLPADLQPFTG
jgi:23S rRNA pseudouridine1911/1915/1917 synthase